MVERPEIQEDFGGIEGDCNGTPHHPWGEIEWQDRPESMGDGDTYGWYGTCRRCGARVVEWLVCDGAEEVTS